MTDAPEPNVVVEEGERVARIVINRPDVANALDPSTVLQLADTYRRLDESGRFHVVVLSGAGRGFSSGHDLKGALAAGGPAPWGNSIIGDWRRLARSNRALLALRDGDTPILATVHGYCLGGAIDLMLMCDLSVVTTDCRFSHPAIRAAGGTPATMAYPARIGSSRTKQFLWVTPEIDGVTAADWGLVNAAVAPESLDEWTDAWAARLASIPKDNLALTRSQLRRADDFAGFRSTIEIGAELDALGHTSDVGQRWQEAVDSLGFAEAVRQRDRAFAAGPDVAPREDSDD